LLPQAPPLRGLARLCAGPTINVACSLSRSVWTLLRARSRDELPLSHCWVGFGGADTRARALSLSLFLFLLPLLARALSFLPLLSRSLRSCCLFLPDMCQSFSPPPFTRSDTRAHAARTCARCTLLRSPCSPRTCTHTRALCPSLDFQSIQKSMALRFMDMILPYVNAFTWRARTYNITCHYLLMGAASPYVNALCQRRMSTP